MEPNGMVTRLVFPQCLASWPSPLAAPSPRECWEGSKSTGWKSHVGCSVRRRSSRHSPLKPRRATMQQQRLAFARAHHLYATACLKQLLAFTLQLLPVSPAPALPYRPCPTSTFHLTRTGPSHLIRNPQSFPPELPPIRSF